ncbi:MAG: TVP38/TMEM64 family protein [Verrucomicrobiota bacterium]|nr:TVP38/TMEM64 family protein [Verrucomicrobiota bacterium]
MNFLKKNARLVAAFALLCLITIAAVFLPIAQWVNAFAEWIRTLGVTGVALFILAFVGAALISLPASVFAAAAGLIYGFSGGAAVALTGAICASTLGFLLARHVFRERVEAFARTHKKFAAIDRALGLQGWKIVGLLRLSPVMPLGLSTYLFGVTSIEFWSYAIASAIGVIPGTLMYVYLGAVGRIGLSGAKHQRSPLEWGLMLAGLLATIAVTLLVGRIAKSALTKTAPAVG